MSKLNPHGYRIKPRVNMVAGTANHGKLVYDVKRERQTVTTCNTHAEATAWIAAQVAKEQG